MGTFSRLHNYTYHKLMENFPGIDIKENVYPDWLVSSNLTRLELDIYIEEMDLAIEIQGKQHFEFVPFFHGTYENFEKGKMYDQEKRDLCYGKGIRLVEVEMSLEVDELIRSIAPEIEIEDTMDYETINKIRDHNTAKRISKTIMKTRTELARFRPRLERITKLIKMTKRHSDTCELQEIPDKELELLYQRFVASGYIKTQIE